MFDDILGVNNIASCCVLVLVHAIVLVMFAVIAAMAVSAIIIDMAMVKMIRIGVWLEMLVVPVNVFVSGGAAVTVIARVTVIVVPSVIDIVIVSVAVVVIAIILVIVIVVVAVMCV